MHYQKFTKLSISIFTLLYLNGCGGNSTPKEQVIPPKINTTLPESNKPVVISPKEVNITEINETKDDITLTENSITVKETPSKEQEEDTSEPVVQTQEDNVTSQANEDNNTEEEEEEPVVIPNSPPVVDAKEDKSVETNQNVTITAEATDSDGEIVSQRWSDESNNTLSTKLSFDYNNSQEGVYTLTFSATDDNGSSASDSMDVNVTEPVEECDPLAELLGGC